MVKSDFQLWSVVCAPLFLVSVINAIKPKRRANNACRTQKAMTRLAVYAICVCVAGCTGVFSTRVGGTFDWPSLNLEPEASGHLAGINQSSSTKQRGGSITGRVVNESGQPIPNAAVYVRRIGSYTSPNRSLGTDEDGRFRADELASGAYWVSAFVPGYVTTADSVEREYYRPGEAVILHMMKGGIITGTITDSSGEPVVGVRVYALRVRDGENRPIRGAGQSGNSRQTDDRGAYRVYGLALGSYLIVARGGGYSPSVFEGDVPTYYPSTTRDAATEVVVRAGEEITGIDIRYRGERGYIVSGTLSGAVGPDSVRRGVALSLARAGSGAIESRAYVLLSVGLGFALYGVPDGEYDLLAQTDIGTDTSAASQPRRVTVKGSDVTGVDLALAPLGSISGRVVLEQIPVSERPSECKKKRASLLDEVVLKARRDDSSTAKDQPTPALPLAAANEGSPNEKGEFKIAGLTSGRYRIEPRPPGDDWYVRSIKKADSKPQNDVADAGLVLSTGQRIADLIVTLAEGAAALRGKVVSASAGSPLPAQLRVHLVPAEPESVNDATRFIEAKVDSEGAYSLNNLPPGRYYIHARALSDEQLIERNPEPVAWNAAARTKLRRDAQAANVVIELQRCQRVADHVLKYAPTSVLSPKKAP